jgi:hypothetical protein
VRVLVCGGRDYDDWRRFKEALDDIHHRIPSIHCVIQGGAGGADRMAWRWATIYRICCIEVRPMWQQLGKAAGPIRNGWMLEYCHPDLVVAFPGHNGTQDMVDRARAARIQVIEVDRDGRRSIVIDLKEACA